VVGEHLGAARGPEGIGLHLGCWSNVETLA
jgi:hypothetical protein